jgi:hypothetical protein
VGLGAVYDFLPLSAVAWGAKEHGLSSAVDGAPPGGQVKVGLLKAYPHTL